MILHYAHLCAAAGGVDAFLIGSELRGLTQVRSGASSYPAVAELVDLAADVRAILGPGTKLSYAADWSEYFGHHPQDGSGDVFFHLDPLWADDGDRLRRHRQLHAARPTGATGSTISTPTSADAITDLDYLRGNVEGGEGFDWFYASAADREAQVRTPITDGAARQALGLPLQGPPQLVVEPAPQPPGRGRERRADGVGAGEQADPVHRDRLPGGRPRPEPAERLLRPEVGRELPAVLLARLARRRRPAALPRGGARLLGRAGEQPDLGRLLGGRMIATAETAAWTWDARPYPAFPARSDVWTDADNWRLGHWLNGRLGSVSLGEPGARALPPRRAARRARSTSRRSPTSCTAT